MLSFLIFITGAYTLLSIGTGARDGEKLENLGDFLNMLKTGYKRKL